jgi:hypothetical protein
MEHHPVGTAVQGLARLEGSDLKGERAELARGDVRGIGDR